MPTNEVQSLLQRHPWESVIVGFLLMCALYTVGFAVGYYEGHLVPRPVHMTPIEDLAKYAFKGTFDDEAVRAKPCWSTLNMEGKPQ